MRYLNLKGTLMASLLLHSLTQAHTLIDVKKACPFIHIDLKYATSDNFTGTAVYPTNARLFLCLEVVEALKDVLAELAPLGLTLLVWDGYRPLDVQKIFWNLVPDPRYVGDPAEGSRHNRGCAIDCTLATLDGTPLLMPTPFDEFTHRAHRTYMGLPADILQNRKLLELIMEKHGFIGIETEWWHFDFKGYKNYPLLRAYLKNQ